MKYLVLLSALLLSGCGGMQLTPNVHRSRITTPYVEFLGDDQIMGLVSYVDNPMWKCTTCVPGQDSQAVLDEVQNVVALHPDIVVILTGAYDFTGPDEHNTPTVTNIEDMLTAFDAAKIPAIVCLMPPSDEYDNYYTDSGIGDLNTIGVIPNIISYDLYTAAQMTVGYDFSTFGLEQAYPVTYAEVESFHVGNLR